MTLYDCHLCGKHNKLCEKSSKNVELLKEHLKVHPSIIRTPAAENADEEDMPEEDDSLTAEQRAALRNVEKSPVEEPVPNKPKGKQKEQSQSSNTVQQVSPREQQTSKAPPPNIPLIALCGAAMYALQAGEQLVSTTLIDIRGMTVELAQIEGFQTTLEECIVDSMPLIEEMETQSPYTRLLLMIAMASFTAGSKRMMIKAAERGESTQVPRDIILDDLANNL
jgi:hypothetical protein